MSGCYNARSQEEFLSIRTTLSKDSQRNTAFICLFTIEEYQDAESAIRRERQMKKWSRRWKIKRIEQQNPEWTDLYDGVT